jgi:hypothetical protein
MGSGKSEIIEKLIKEHNKVLIISTRKVFTLAM